MLYRVHCPICHDGPSLPHMLSRHLRTAHSYEPEEARAAAQAAPRDVTPFLARIRELEQMRANAKRRKAATKPELRDAWEAVVISCNGEIARLERLGPNQYEPPPGFYDEE